MVTNLFQNVSLPENRVDFVVSEDVVLFELFEGIQLPGVLLLCQIHESISSFSKLLDDIKGVVSYSFRCSHCRVSAVPLGRSAYCAISI